MRTNLTIVFLFFLLVTKAQDIHFSQFYENSIMRNPALTGIFSGDYKAGINYRTQWSSISAPFRTGLAIAESKIKLNEVNDHLSFGLSLIYDQAGTTSFNSLYAFPALNYNKCLTDRYNSYLSFGVTTGFVQRSVNSAKMIFSDQYQNGVYSPDQATAENIGNLKITYPDLGAGVSFNSSIGESRKVNYYIGGAAYHLNKPKIAFNSDEAYLRMPVKWNGNAGLTWIVDEHTHLNIHANYSKQGINKEVIGGFLLSRRSLDMATGKKSFAVAGGVFYRLRDAWIPTFKLEYKTYTVTFSYDVNTSELNGASNGRGGFEMSLFTKGFFDRGIWATDKTKCPRFEEMLEMGY